VLERLFGKRKPAPSADRVWRSDAARLRGVCREVGGFVRFAASIEAGGFATFHLSLADPLLAAHAGNLGPMLDKLGMTDDEPISHSFVSRAIEKAQR
jgi:hypothetical protein